MLFSSRKRLQIWEFRIWDKSTILASLNGSLGSPFLRKLSQKQTFHANQSPHGPRNGGTCEVKLVSENSMVWSKATKVRRPQAQSCG